MIFLLQLSPCWVQAQLLTTLTQYLNFTAWTCKSGREISQGAVTHLCVSSNNILWPQVSGWCNQLLHGRTGNNGGKELQRGKGLFSLNGSFFFLKVNYVCIFLRCNQSIAMTGIQKMYLKQSSLVHQSASQGKSLRVGYGPFRTLIIVFLSREKSTSILT